MDKNRKSRLNNKYSNGRDSTSGNGAPTEIKKAKAKRRVMEVHNEEALNAQVKQNADINNTQLINPEIVDLLDDMLKIASNVEATASDTYAVQSMDLGKNSVEVTRENGSGDGTSEHEYTIEDIGNEEDPVVRNPNVPLLEFGLGQQNRQPKISLGGVTILEDNNDLRNTKIVPIYYKPNNVNSKGGTQSFMEQLNNTHNNGGQPRESDKNNTASQSTQKNEWPVVTPSVLAITGIASGVAVAFYLEILAIGIAVAALCLIAVTALYCYRPKSSIENNDVTKVADNVPAVS